MDKGEAKNILARVVGGATHPSYTDIREACRYALDVLKEPSLPSDVDDDLESIDPKHLVHEKVEEPYKSMEEEMEKFIETFGWGKTKHLAEKELISATARHFAKWGAEHLRDSTKMIDKSLEEAAENIYKVPFGTRAEDFIAGAEWKASRMPMPEDTVLFNKGVAEGRRLEREDILKDAVEGKICGRVYDHINVRFADGVGKYLAPKNISHIPADVSKYNIGDKVRIVVLKEEEE